MSDLREFLRIRFEKAGGAVSFEDFMAMAIYDPEHGYYSRQIEDVGGNRGDFATSATLSEGLARAITRWIERESEHHEWHGQVTVIEVGAGNGALAQSLLKGLGWWKRRRLRYRIVEVSAPLRVRQKQRLTGLGVAWHSSIGEALDAADGRALIFSNELIDAFPARWLRWSADDRQWHEIFVDYSPAGGLKETFRLLPRGFPLDTFAALRRRDWPDGQRVEIQPMVQRWLANLADHLNQGSLLTIDYGGSTAEIYERRPSGTLRAYHRHQRIEGGGVYARFGQQDLTVDANFDDLREWGEEFGLETVRYESQRQFLERHGAGLDPMAGPGPGDAFRVLHQRKD